MGSDHRAWAEIDLAAFRHNLGVVKKLAGAAQVWPVLKANAYGHGARALARVCAEEGVERIGVGDSGEALELRASGVRLPLLVLGTVIDAEVQDLLQHDIEVGVHSESRVRMLAAAARTAGRPLGVHLKVDTGMTRLGVRPEALLRVARAIRDEPGLELRGLMTHFAGLAGWLDGSTREQLALFLSAVEKLGAEGIRVPATHCANSAALFTGLQPLGSAVRPGIALYGVLPSEVAQAAAARGLDGDLRPVMSLRAQIVFLKDVPPGTAVGYGRRWIASRPTRLATLPIGYFDGVPWRIGQEPRVDVLVRGQRCRLVGAVSMDYCTLDVSEVEGASTGDVATFIGGDQGERVHVEEIAAAAGTIPYEITCSIGSRVPRVYRDAPLETLQSAAG